uniref:Uncharacterized protein n=1 Tax=Mycena chlorophos TaxID=658473 RepID=A0ABQ0LRH1_MYCCL|nr:predicted protein [Mycena chlorophos]
MEPPEAPSRSFVAPYLAVSLQVPAPSQTIERYPAPSSFGRLPLLQKTSRFCILFRRFTSRIQRRIGIGQVQQQVLAPASSPYLVPSEAAAHNDHV